MDLSGWCYARPIIITQIDNRDKGMGTNGTAVRDPTRLYANIVPTGS